LEAVFQGHHHVEILELSEALSSRALSLQYLAINYHQLLPSNGSFQLQHAHGQALPNVLPMALVKMV
jgi:hypothetical protein